jgi:capsule polysaccharide export protein KpsE/RkpR
MLKGECGQINSTRFTLMILFDHLLKPHLQALDIVICLGPGSDTEQPYVWYQDELKVTDDTATKIATCQRLYFRYI